MPNPVYSPHTNVRLFMAIMEQLRSNEHDFALFTPSEWNRMYKNFGPVMVINKSFLEHYPKCETMG